MPGDAVKCPWCGDCNCDCDKMQILRSARSKSQYKRLSVQLGLDRRDGIYNDCEEIADYMEENSWT